MIGEPTCVSFNDPILTKEERERDWELQYDSLDSTLVHHYLGNPLRIYVGKNLKCIGSIKHPLYEKYMDISKGKTGFYKWKSVYDELGILLPDVVHMEKIKDVHQTPFPKVSVNSQMFFDYLGISKDRREIKVGKSTVDAVHEDYIIEFLGDFHHANPNIYDVDDMVFGKSAADEWQSTYRRFIKKGNFALNHKLKIVWANDWTNFMFGLTYKVSMYDVLPYFNELFDIKYQNKWFN